MKLALATISTALVLGTSASAMIGPYERAVADATVKNGLFTRGEQQTVESSDVSSRAFNWNNGQPRDVTVFPTKDDSVRDHNGFEGR